MLKRLASLSSARQARRATSDSECLAIPTLSRVMRGYPVGRVLLSQTGGPLDFHRATIVFRSLLDAGTLSFMEAFARARHPDGVVATATLDLLVWLGRLLATDVA